MPGMQKFDGHLPPSQCTFPESCSSPEQTQSNPVLRRDLHFISKNAGLQDPVISFPVGSGCVYTTHLHFFFPLPACWHLSPSCLLALTPFRLQKFCLPVSSHYLCTLGILSKRRDVTHKPEYRGGSCTSCGRDLPHRE